MKRAFQKRSLEQLRSETWPDKAAALKELKRNGFVERGDDYALGEFKPGAWMVLPLEAAPFADEPAPPAPAPAKSARAKRATQKAPAGESEVQSSPPPAPAPEPPAAVSANDLSALPASEGPYDLCIREGEAEKLPRHGANAWALELMRWARGTVYIRDNTGAVVRTIAFDPSRKDRPSGTVGRRDAGSAPRATGKSAQAAALLFRSEGATFAEIVEVTEWSVSERFVNRLAKTHKAQVEQIGEKHYRLIKQ